MEDFSKSPIKPRQSVNVVLYFCVVLALFLSVTLLTRGEAVNVDDAQQLADFDFSSGIAYISEACFDAYPKALHTPDDFAAGRVAEPPAADGGGKAGYVTYRLVLELERGRVYGLTGYSATYAQALWIDGELLAAVGVPGDSLETMTPKTAYFTVYFEAKSEQTEIVIQRSDFVHANGGQLFPLYLGRQQLISPMNAGMQMRVNIMVGSMLMAALFFFGIFLFFQNRKHFLWFSFACLLNSIRTLIIDHKAIMTLFPDLDWTVSLRLEYVAMIGFLFFFFLYINCIFNWRLNRYVNLFGLIVSALYLIVVLVTPSNIYTRVLPFVRYCIVVYALAAFFLLTRDMIKNRENRRLEHVLIFLGTAAYIIITIFDLILHNRGGRYDNVNLMQVGMMAFVFTNALALTLNFNRAERALEHAQQNEREMEETNRLLERLNQIKSDFLSSISHEMKTPLAVISGYAGATIQQMEKNAVTMETKKNLDTIQREAVRLGLLVEGMKDVALEKQRQLARTDTDVRALLKRAADFCTPICQKNGNAVILRVGPEPGLLRVDADAIFQVLFNLITNANRHTREGVIVLAARMDEDDPDGGAVVISVYDNGDGIPPELLPSVLERGVSGDGGTGLGLAICKEIIEEHGGKIEITSGARGTMVCFTLPHAKGEKAP